MPTDFEAIFKAYDVRGIVGEQLDASGVHAIGAAFAHHVWTTGDSSILVGRDMRPDGEELAAAFSEGAQSQGINVVDLGLCATDMLYFASGYFNIGGAVFTASHNPVGYNGIKMCLARAAPIGIDTGLETIKDLAIAGLAPAVNRGSYTQVDLLDRYTEHVLSFVDVRVLKPLRVVVDSANGMAGMLVPAVFEGLPFQLEHMYAELDGTFPNHPADPLVAENCKDLIGRVRATEADIGLAFDGDADRVFVIDNTGQILSGSLTTALIARAVLAQEPGATIVHNVICSKVVPEVISAGNGKVVRSRVGHSYIKDVMAKSQATFGGEHSGHYYFRDNFGADNATIAALMVLEELSKSTVGLAELVADLRRYSNSGEINTKVSDPQAAIVKVAKVFARHKQDRLDGLTVDVGDWWFNLRPSNTEPLLRLNVETTKQSDLEPRTQEILNLLD